MISIISRSLQEITLKFDKQNLVRLNHVAIFIVNAKDSTM